MYRLASLSCLSLMSALLFAVPLVAPSQARAEGGSCCAGKAAKAAEAAEADCACGKAKAKDGSCCADKAKAGSCCAGKAEGACDGEKGCAGCEGCPKCAGKASGAEKAGKAEGSCHGDQAAAAPAKRAHPQVANVSVSELVSLINRGEVTVLDANAAAGRQMSGIIPGAVLLTSASGYQLAELPADKGAKLVFYCSGSSCGASKKAALRAVQAGYTEVSVLPEGIAGWKQAGQRVAGVPRT